MSVSTFEELRGLEKSGAIVATVLRAMAHAIRPGVTTAELDEIGERLLAHHGAVPAPRATYAFPGATCISVNDEVAHGIPGDRTLDSGDVVNIDVSAHVQGFYTDTGASFPVGEASPEVRALCNAGRAALRAGVGRVRTGTRFSTLGQAIEREADQQGYRVIRDLTGHGVGRSLHEEPSDVRSYFEPLDTRTMSNGLVFTIEPMLSRTADSVFQDEDGWTLRTLDGSKVVQYEHTVVVTPSGPIVLTDHRRRVA